MYYIMSDIHGCHKEFRSALRKWDDRREILVIMGDFIDRGPDSIKMIKELMTLKKAYGDRVIVLMGNHEQMLVSWLSENEDCQDYYYSNTHLATLISALGSSRVVGVKPSKIAEYMFENYREHIEWMESLPLFYEAKKSIFVHAGVNFDLGDWREDSDYLLWARNEFIYSKTPHKKKVFFGHTRTNLIHSSDEIWISPNGKKVCIDGGVSNGGQLNALKVDEEGEIKDIYRIKSKK